MLLIWDGLRGRCCFLAVPKSNLGARRAVRAEAQRRGVVRNHAICIGDVAAYCADARETVQAVRDVGCVVVPGVTWVNAAVVGMPPNDGRAETRCATLEGVPR